MINSGKMQKNFTNCMIKMKYGSLRGKLLRKLLQSASSARDVHFPGLSTTPKDNRRLMSASLPDQL